MKDKKATDFERELKIAYHKHATAKGISLIDKAFYKAYDGDTKMMIALLKKLVADKTEQKGTLVDQSQHDHYYSQVKVIIDDNPDIPPALKARLGLSRSE